MERETKTVVCDYCGEEVPKYSAGQDGLKREVAPKMANGLRRCAYCTIELYLEDANVSTDNEIRGDVMTE